MDSDRLIPDYEPLITLFYCERCCGPVEDPAVTGHPQGAAFRQHTMCAAEVGRPRIREAFTGGADGVLIVGCHGNTCHKGQGELEFLQQIYAGTQEIRGMGLAPVRLQREWVAPADATRVAGMVDSFRRRLAPLGPRRLEASQTMTGVGATA